MRRVTISLGMLLAATTAAAQGTISTQGFGYPAGGVSTKAAAAGAAFAEFDFLSPRNPSSLLGWGRGGLYLQYEPEFRAVNAGTGSEKTTTARFPLVMAAMQAGSSTIVALSSTTMLDRTWATRVRSGQILGPDSVTFEEKVASNGAVNDIRLAFAHSLRESFSIGIGGHVYTGENRMQLERIFDDSLKFGAISRGLSYSYTGNAVSAGATWRPHRSFAIAASARAGGTMKLYLADTLLAKAEVPGRYSFAGRFDAVPGVSIGVGAEHTRWSSMKQLGSTRLSTKDAWEYGAGAEMTGPRMGVMPMLFYAGYRTRDLPFTISGGDVSEDIMSVGASIPLAGPRAVLDLGFQRASRTSLEGVKEGALIFSMGLTVRP
jgi:hypothetical protein